MTEGPVSRPLTTLSPSPPQGRFVVCEYDEVSLPHRPDAKTLKRVGQRFSLAVGLVSRSRATLPASAHHHRREGQQPQGNCGGGQGETTTGNRREPRTWVLSDTILLRRRRIRVK